MRKKTKNKIIQNKSKQLGSKRQSGSSHAFIKTKQKKTSKFTCKAKGDKPRFRNSADIFSNSRSKVTSIKEMSTSFICKYFTFVSSFSLYKRKFIHCKHTSQHLKTPYSHHPSILIHSSIQNLPSILCKHFFVNISLCKHFVYQ